MTTFSKYYWGDIWMNPFDLGKFVWTRKKRKPPGPLFKGEVRLDEKKKREVDEIAKKAQIRTRILSVSRLSLRSTPKLHEADAVELAAEIVSEVFV